jgi:uroporphyrinogen-III synthase
MEIRLTDGPEISLEGVQAILATSANGACALARRTSRRDLPVFAVGPQTTLAARAAGFTDVRDADGNAGDLAEIVSRWLDPRRGALLHAAGRERKGELAASLEAAGFTLRSEALYEAIPAAEFTPDARAALATGNLDAVMLFSPRSAAIFAGLVQQAGLSQACHTLAAICISQAAASALEPLKFAQIRVANRPNQDSLLALLDGS